LATLRVGLRQGAADQRPDDGAFARLAPELLARTTLDQDANWGRRVRDVIEEKHHLWIIGGALAATMTMALLMVTVLNATPVKPGSLASLLRTSVALGSNANPIALATGVTWAGPTKDRFAYATQLLPRVTVDTRAAAMLIQPLPPLLLENLTLTAVVTREGQLASVEVLRNEAPDADLARAISRLASGVQFVPPHAAGAPIAVNVVWLLERMTVRAES
jgi:hypothetical protein